MLIFPVRQSLSKSLFSMLHHPVPMDATASLDPTHSCMPLSSSSSCPRARQVIEKIKRQASALVKSPSRRARPHSCTGPGQLEQTLRVPTVTFVAASSVESTFSGCSDDDALLHIDAPVAGDFVPCLEHDTPHTPVPTSPPLSDATTKFSVVPPPSPSSSARSDSTSSIPSPVTPVFVGHHDVHPYVSAAVTSKRWSVGSYEQDQNNDPFVKAKMQIVRRSLIQDSFLIACAAVDDAQQGPAPVEDNIHGARSPKGKHSSMFKKKSNTSLPPLKPPPSCPLPSPPSACAECSTSLLDLPTATSSTADQEWTLFLGVPSKPLEVLDIKAEPRKRAGSSPVPSPLPKQHLSPTDIPPQVQPRSRTFSSFSTRSHATGRRIESGPAPDPEDADADGFDWTLSLPVPKKLKPSLNILALSRPPTDAKTRKCKNLTDWTVDLAAPDERQENYLRGKGCELERESHISAASASTASVRVASQHSVKQLPIGPEPSPSQIHPSHLDNTSPVNFNHSISKSMTSLHSTTLSVSSSSTKSSYKDSLSFDPCSPDIAPVSPTAPSFSNHSTYADSLFIIPNARSPSLASNGTSTPSIANFPLPPSFSHKLAQRRPAALPMPRPLHSTGKYRSHQSFSVYADASHALTLPIISSLPLADLGAHIATSAPATSLHFPPSSFPSGPLRNLKKGRPRLYYNPPTTSSSVDSHSDATTSTVSATSSKSSIRTASSASTIVPRTRTSMLIVNISADVQSKQRIDCEPLSSLLNAGDIAEEAFHSDPTRPSIESSAMATEYYTCNEDGLSDEEAASLRRRHSPVEADENSDRYHSARSSLDLLLNLSCGDPL